MWQYWLVNNLFKDQPQFIAQSFPMDKETIHHYALQGWRVIENLRPELSEYY